MDPAWSGVFLAITLYCIWQAIRDFRQRKYVMSTAGAVCAVLLVIMPVPMTAHMIKLDMRSSE